MGPLSIYREAVVARLLLPVAAGSCARSPPVFAAAAGSPLRTRLSRRMRRGRHQDPSRPGPRQRPRRARRPFDLRLRQHALWRRLGRPADQEPVGQARLGRPHPRRRRLRRAARLRRHGLRRHRERLGLRDRCRAAARCSGTCTSGPPSALRSSTRPRRSARVAGTSTRSGSPARLSSTPPPTRSSSPRRPSCRATSDWQGIRHWLVAISLTTPHRCSGTATSTRRIANNPSHYYIPAEQQRPAITLAERAALRRLRGPRR